MFKVMSMEQGPLRRVQRLAAGLALVLLLAVFWLGPQVMSRHLIPVPWDKLVHLLTYALLVVALGLVNRLQSARGLWLALVVAVLVGALDEYLQIGQPGRSADWADLGANCAGAALGFAWLAMMAKQRDRRVKHPAHEDMD